MEYAVKVTMSPTPRTDRFIARVYISAVEDDMTRGTQLVHESDVYFPTPEPDTKVLDWTSTMLLLARAHLVDSERFANISTEVKVMGDLFEPKLF